MTTEAEKSRAALRDELSGNPPALPPPSSAITRPAVELQKPITITKKHSDRCPELRGQECACAANLVWLGSGAVKPLERVTQEWVESIPVREAVDAKGVRTPAHTLTKPHKIELWKVDAGRTRLVMKPAVTGSLTAKPIQTSVRDPERWVCTACGWAGRGSNPSHRCDKTAVALATRQQTVAEMLTREQRFSGAYRLVTWRDQNQKYHLAEEFVEDGQVVKTVLLFSTESWDELEGAYLGEMVDRFSL